MTTDPCQCGRGDILASISITNLRAVLMPIGAQGHAHAANYRCADCIAEEVAFAWAAKAEMPATWKPGFAAALATVCPPGCEWPWDDATCPEHGRCCPDHCTSPDPEEHGMYADQHCTAHCPLAVVAS